MTTANKSLQATRDGDSSFASLFTLVGPYRMTLRYVVGTAVGRYDLYF